MILIFWSKLGSKQQSEPYKPFVFGSYHTYCEQRLQSIDLSGPPEFTCWICFAPVVQFYLLLSHYLCFISFLYIELYVLVDGALIS